MQAGQPCEAVTATLHAHDCATSAGATSGAKGAPGGGGGPSSAKLPINSNNGNNMNHNSSSHRDSNIGDMVECNTSAYVQARLHHTKDGVCLREKLESMCNEATTCYDEKR